MGAPVIIRIGCELDDSVEEAFAAIERRALRAAERIEALGIPLTILLPEMAKQDIEAACPNCFPKK